MVSLRSRRCFPTVRSRALSDLAKANRDRTASHRTRCWFRHAPRPTRRRWYYTITGRNKLTGSLKDSTVVEGCLACLFASSRLVWKNPHISSSRAAVVFFGSSFFVCFYFRFGLLLPTWYSFCSFWIRFIYSFIFSNLHLTC